MAIRAYFDESYTDGRVYVIAGYLARVEDWAAFAQEWEGLLPLTARGRNGKLRFKMDEMKSRMDSVPLFYDVIRKYAKFNISVMVNARDYERAKSRIWSDNVDIAWTPDTDPEPMLARNLLYLVYNACWEDERIREWISPGEKIDLYFDRGGRSKNILLDWDDAVAKLPDHIADLVGDEPRFVDDEEFYPLQAADFWAWWVREGYEQGRINEVSEGDFGPWKAKKVSGVRFHASEDQIVKTLMDGLKKGGIIPLLTNIYDENVTPRTANAMNVYTFAKRSSFLSYIGQKLNRLRKKR
jgi:hypothetical protein